MITDNNISCPFCILESNRDVVIENENAFSIFDKFPVSNGHLLIIPKLHCYSYFDLDIEITLKNLKLLSNESIFFIVYII